MRTGWFGYVGRHPEWAYPPRFDGAGVSFTCTPEVTQSITGIAVQVLQRLGGRTAVVFGAFDPWPDHPSVKCHFEEPYSPKRMFGLYAVSDLQALDDTGIFRPHIGWAGLHAIASTLIGEFKLPHLLSQRRIGQVMDELKAYEWTADLIVWPSGFRDLALSVGSTRHTTEEVLGALYAVVPDLQLIQDDAPEMIHFV